MKQVSMTVTYTVETAQQTHSQVMEDDSISRVDLLVWGPLLGVPTLSWFDGDESAVASLLGRVGSVSDAHLGDSGRVRSPALLFRYRRTPVHGGRRTSRFERAVQ
ncbi:hypothetical protein [Haladaptatus sp. W1]|uniref:hypothetical protein n=1 Tax=Haladaptatus sp. W1 TaxID=1897478 RepID=UPI001C30E2E1|nr:hypothetical protein [Haladaptatus sp. W1]